MHDATSVDAFSVRPENNQVILTETFSGVSRGRTKCGKIMELLQEKIRFEIREDALWMPIYSRPLHEFRLLEYFKVHHIPAYLPLVPGFKIHNVVKNDKTYSYRQEVERPMLKSYIFAQMNQDEQRALWMSKSVNKILAVPFANQAGFLEELRGLQMMEALAKSSVKLEFKREFQVNDRFVIESPREFEGTYGYLVEKRKKFLWVIKIETLGQYVNVEIDPAFYKFRRV